jgi:uncharacterized protein (TIGR03435 family)
MRETVSLRKGLLITATGMVVLAGALAAALLNAPPVRAQSPALDGIHAGFEVASIKPSASCGGLGRGGSSAPGLLNLCGTVSSFINTAYVRAANGRLNAFALVHVEGGPAWINSELFQISAKAVGNPGNLMMSGPMLQALLEDRFRLRVHHETREVSAYALTVAKGGPKLQPSKEGSCTTVDLSKPAVPPEPGQKFCGLAFTTYEVRGPNSTREMHAGSLDQLSTLLGSILNRPVINKTGIAGAFDFFLEYSSDLNTANAAPTAPSDESAYPSIFTAVQEKLGLRLEATKGPGEFLVIDQVERPRLD